MNILKNILRKIYYKELYYTKKVKVMNSSRLDFITKLEGMNVIKSNTTIVNSQIGFATYIGGNSKILYTHIGRYCSIAPNLKTIIYTHPTHNFVTTHPAFFSTRKQSGFTYVKEDKFEEDLYLDKKNNICIEIGNDVWIGENVIILGGVKIGNGAIIGTGAIVTKDIEPYSINVGIPAKKIDYRFKQEDIKFLNDLKWWNKGKDWIEKHSEYFENIDKLKEVLQEEKKLYKEDKNTNNVKSFVQDDGKI